MPVQTFVRACVASSLCALLVSPLAAQDAPQAPSAPRRDLQASDFAAPVRLHAGEKFLGEKRLFPSPVFHDVNGDGLRDLVIGDLPGSITVALRLAGDGPAKYGAEERLQAADGRPLDFNNW